MSDSSTSAGARAALVVAAVGAVFTAGLMLVVSEPGAMGASGLLVLGAFIVFAVSPYAALAFAARRITDRIAGWVALIIGLVITIPASLLYILGFFVQPDAQSGLLFLFVPVYQFLAGGAVVLISAIVLRLSGRAGTTR